MFFLSRRAISRASLLLSALAVASAAQATTSTWVSTSSKALPLDPRFVTSAVPATQTMHVVVALKTQHLDTLKSYVLGQRKPGNPAYGQTMTAAQTIANFSPSAAQAQQVMDYLSSKGFKNLKLSDSRMMLRADVTAADAQAAFNTHLVNFKRGEQTLRVNLSDVQVPSALADLVQGVIGLQTAIQPHTNIAGRKPLTDLQAVKPSTSDDSDPTAGLLPPPTFTAAAFRKAYNADAISTGANSTLGIITGGTDLLQVIADLRQVETETGLPYVPVEIRQLADVPDPQVTDNDGEWDLDSQSASGIAGNLKKIIFYNGAGLDDGIDLGTDKFVSDNEAQALNISIGGCEALNVLLGSSDIEDPLYMKAAAQGQTVFVSAGDAGAACSVLINLGTPDSGIPSVEYPASSPYVVAVGGTSLYTDASTGDYSQEITWTGTGGGTSTFETAPDYQNSAGVTPTTTLFRAVPDIAMNAGFNVAVAAFYAAADTVVGGVHEAVIGTSLSSPLSAGVWMRMQTEHCNGYGFAAPLIYALDTATGPLSTATGFHDVTLGTNGLWVATPGWDYTTGFGSFDVGAVNAALPAADAGCKVANVVPTATLTANYTQGNAPLSIVFDASTSRDGDGDALAYYAIDFGDNTPLAFQSTPTFAAHSYTRPGTYVARLQVRDSRGAVSTLATQQITVGGIPESCKAPGATIITSPAGVSSGVEGTDVGSATDDLLSTQIAEPYDKPNLLVFTMKVDNLSTVMPGFRWVTYFNIPEDPADEYYVAMVSSDGATPVFNYGTHGTLPGAGLGDFTVLGSLDASSAYNADGTITLVLDKSLLKLQTGDALSNIISSVRVSIPDDTSGAIPLGEGLTQDSAGAAQAYTLLGNDSCATLVKTGGLIATGGGSSGGSTGGSSGSSGGGGGGAFGTVSLLVLGLAGFTRRRRRS
ncbi:protease pro-enzyme activation domain-containing protein [Hydrocarboniphaga sp.]|uniref:protease pro-enzyme activation domain-containing protein n=1 Tax=Hydrocarboniphaga sp. TaxID=2033016 RepID=UPI003D0B5C9E